jgi:hypothetical protein
VKINGTAPDFYMGSWESYVLGNPRQCWRVKRLTTPRRRDDLLLITVDPAVPGEPYALANDMDYVIVACHNVDDSLFPISTFPAAPLPVYVARPLVDWRDRTNLNGDELTVFAWGELYPSEAEARAKMTYALARKYGKQI